MKIEELKYVFVPIILLLFLFSQSCDPAFTKNYFFVNKTDEIQTDIDPEVFVLDLPVVQSIIDSILISNGFEKKVYICLLYTSDAADE